MRTIVQVISPPLKIQDEVSLTRQFAYMCRHRGIIKSVEDLSVCFPDAALISQRHHLADSGNIEKLIVTTIYQPPADEPKPDKETLERCKSKILVRFSNCANPQAAGQGSVAQDVRYILARQIRVKPESVQVQAI